MKKECTGRVPETLKELDPDEEEFYAEGAEEVEEGLRN
jgi:hypothetical protein